MSPGAKTEEFEAWELHMPKSLDQFAFFLALRHVGVNNAGNFEDVDRVASSRRSID